MWAESKGEGRGSKFHCEIHAARAALAIENRLSGAHQSLSELISKSCLIVESHPTTRMVLRELTEQFGIQTESTDTWNSAFAMATQASEDGKGFSTYRLSFSRIINSKLCDDSFSYRQRVSTRIWCSVAVEEASTKKL